jgi:hypothetical protein
MQPPIKFVWKGNHHSYYGIFFIVFGLFNWYMGNENGNLEGLIPFWQAFIVAGGFFIADDIVEHTVTASTPLRKTYQYLVDRGLIQSKTR